MASNYDLLLKFIVIGDTNVGKSCLSLMFTENKYNAQHEATLGVQFASKNIKIDDYLVRVQIWDTAGQESFKSITRSYYRGSIGAIIVYDITKRETFENISKWVQEVRSHSHEKVNMVLIGNKSDLSDRRQVPQDEGQRAAVRLGFDFAECSAKTGQNVENIFRNLAVKVIKQVECGKLDLDNDANYGIRRGKSRKNMLNTKLSTDNTAASQPNNNCSC